MPSSEPNALPEQPAPPASESRPDAAAPAQPSPVPVRPDPTRYGDWEKNGRCIDF